MSPTLEKWFRRAGTTGILLMPMAILAVTFGNHLMISVAYYIILVLLIPFTILDVIFILRDRRAAKP